MLLAKYEVISMLKLFRINVLSRLVCGRRRNGKVSLTRVWNIPPNEELHCHVGQIPTTSARPTSTKQSENPVKGTRHVCYAILLTSQQAYKLRNQTIEMVT